MSGELPPRTYVESTIIMTTVRIISPFVFTFGLFVMLHGAEAAGGGFQGGVILASSIVMIAFAFGIDPTREWLSDALVRVAIGGGVGLFALIGLGALVAQGNFLEYEAFDVHHGVKYGIELVEIGIGAVVSGVIISLFMNLAAGFSSEDEESGGESA